MAETVFQIPELLEMTILYLPTQDMQVSRGVCKAWRDAIDSSIHIKRALFLVPGTCSDRAYDIAAWPVDSNCTIAGIPKPCEKYCTHPFFGDDDAAAGSVSMYNIVWHGRRSLRRVFLTQPPSMTAVTEFTIRPSKDYEGMVIELEAFETFGSLYAKLADANAPDVMEWIEYEAIVEWGYKDYGNSPRSFPWR
ncbi:hypothetical protein LTR56_024118 [Elasticomyces elasticus]|nr:hypothetical protein LTR56_024118 [Elasticomyces elasticus]KAK3623851.1 hypothetical protein LTR22_024212 [Elasticomyces elasticus]KAK4914997.1 hypothetical protein LTR49_016862 [Elasticomyces elasticus]KAK5746049.1 hypothetical protein LTS12_022907 [Elasticomyces elasticus]